MKTIDSIEAVELKNGKYRYTAIFADGSTEVIRASATRLYQNAYEYNQVVSTGARSALAKTFSFGKAPDAYYRDKVINIYPVRV